MNRRWGECQPVAATTETKFKETLTSGEGKTGQHDDVVMLVMSSSIGCHRSDCIVTQSTVSD